MSVVLKPIFVKKPKIRIRDMSVDDIPKVFHLGEKLYSASKLPFLYRTWDPYEVAYLFSSETDLSIIAERSGEVIGFCLSTTIEKPNKPWRYGYLIWLGVSEEFQSFGIGKKLVKEMLKRMKEKKVKYMLIDTEEANKNATAFFKKMGFEIRHKQIWMWKQLDKVSLSSPSIDPSILLITTHKKR